MTASTSIDGRRCLRTTAIQDSSRSTLYRHSPAQAKKNSAAMMEEMDLEDEGDDDEPLLLTEHGEPQDSNSVKISAAFDDADDEDDEDEEDGDFDGEAEDGEYLDDNDLSDPESDLGDELRDLQEESAHSRGRGQLAGLVFRCR